MKKLIFAGSLLCILTMSSCMGKSDANVEQIEEARQQAQEITEGYDASKSMKPGDNKVVVDTAGITEITVSEAAKPE